MASGKCDQMAPPSPTSPQKNMQEKKKSGVDMMKAPIVHRDEAFWLGMVAYMCWSGDYWVLGFCVSLPLFVYIACSVFSKPGDSKACNNICLVDLREEFQTPSEVVDAIKDARPLEDKNPRANSEWIRFFHTSLTPDSMEELDRHQQRQVHVMSQGGEYLPKASNAALGMIIYSFCVTGLVLSRYEWLEGFKLVAISGAMINLKHILRDHSISGLTHHGAHNVGEFDKLEFIRRGLRLTLVSLVVSYFVQWRVLRHFAALACIGELAKANHTLTHYTRLDIKGKGLAWKLVLEVQEALAFCKLVTSKEYHAYHHFHEEMSYPAILMPFNEYLSAKSLTPFLTSRLSEKHFAMVDKFTLYYALFFMCCAIA